MSSHPEGQPVQTTPSCSPRQTMRLKRLGVTSTKSQNPETESKLHFTFAADTPLDRARCIASHDMLDWLQCVVEEAQTVSFRRFAKLHPELGPYATPVIDKLAIGTFTLVSAGVALEIHHTLQEGFQALSHFAL